MSNKENYKSINTKEGCDNCDFIGHLVEIQDVSRFVSIFSCPKCGMLQTYKAKSPYDKRNPHTYWYEKKFCRAEMLICLLCGYLLGILTLIYFH